MNWNDIWTSFVEFCKTSGLNILYALLALLGGIIVIKIVLKLLNTSFEKAKMEKITQSFVLSIIKFALYVFLWLIVFTTLGIDISGLVAFLAAAGVAIGLALKDSLSNLANGIIIITTKPFKEGDLVNVNGVEGKVYSIKMLSTKLLTVDNKIIVMPNSAIISNSVINYSDRHLRRVDIGFEVDYASDLELVKNTILEVMHSNGHILLEPAPFVSLNKMNASSLEIISRCWVHTEDYWDVYYYLMDHVYNEFKRHNINIPFNQMEVRMREDIVEAPFRKEALPKRIEIEREPMLEKEDLIIPLPIEVNKKIAKKSRLRKLQREKESQTKKLEKINRELKKYENLENNNADNNEKEKNISNDNLNEKLVDSDKINQIETKEIAEKKKLDAIKKEKIMLDKEIQENSDMPTISEDGDD